MARWFQPNFPTDVPDFVLHDLRRPARSSFCRRRCSGAFYITALDFGMDGIRAINDITESGVGQWLTAGLGTFEHEKILALDGSHGIAVSETLQLAVMFTARMTSSWSTWPPAIANASGGHRSGHLAPVSACGLGNCRC